MDFPKNFNYRKWEFNMQLGLVCALALEEKDIKMNSSSAYTYIMKTKFKIFYFVLIATHVSINAKTLNDIWKLLSSFIFDIWFWIESWVRRNKKERNRWHVVRLTQWTWEFIFDFLSLAHLWHPIITNIICVCKNINLKKWSFVSNLLRLFYSFSLTMFCYGN